MVAHQVPPAGKFASAVLSMVTIAVLAFCLTRRIQAVKNWKKLTLIGWLIIVIYIDSFLFILTTAVLQRTWSLNESNGVCDAAILLCLVCYLTTKVLIYYFLVEKVYIVRGFRISRFKNKLWLFNFFGVICPYIIVIVINFIFRIARINNNGVCIIGMKQVALLPLISFELVLNVYLTSLFIHPLRQMYSYRHGANSKLRTMALRSFIGSCATLTSSVANMTVITILNGEPGWVCLMICNCDILFSVLILHWVTSVKRSDDDLSYATPTAPPPLPSARRHPSDVDFSFSAEDTGVTTLIEADGKEKPDDVAMDAIGINVHQVQEVEMKGDGSCDLDLPFWTDKSHKRKDSQHIADEKV